MPWHRRYQPVSAGGDRDSVGDACCSSLCGCLGCLWIVLTTLVTLGAIVMTILVSTYTGVPTGSVADTVVGFQYIPTNLNASFLHINTTVTLYNPNFFKADVDFKTELYATKDNTWIYLGTSDTISTTIHSGSSESHEIRARFGAPAALAYSTLRPGSMQLLVDPKIKFMGFTIEGILIRANSTVSNATAWLEPKQLG